MLSSIFEVLGVSRTPLSSATWLIMYTPEGLRIVDAPALLSRKALSKTLPGEVRERCLKFILALFSDHIQGPIESEV
jgi:hypothetical protein